MDTNVDKEGWNWKMLDTFVFIKRSSTTPGSEIMTTTILSPVDRIYLKRFFSCVRVIKAWNCHYTRFRLPLPTCPAKHTPRYPASNATVAKFIASSETFSSLMLVWRAKKKV